VWPNDGAKSEDIVRIPRRLAAVVSGGVLYALFASASALADGAAPETGVWQKHQYSFAFLGFTTTYSCDGLASKLKVLLIASGARSDAKARAGACASGFGRPDKFARSELTFYSLAPAPTDKPADGPVIDAQWRAVALADRKPRELSTGDCELVEQFRSNVLPMLTTRNIESRTTCIPHQNSGSVIDLRFESLSALPHKADHKATPSSAP
jgi:hypothetical protein